MSTQSVQLDVADLQQRLRIDTERDNTAYAFLSGSAQGGATRTYGIKSISLLAVKP